MISCLPRLAEQSSIRNKLMRIRIYDGWLLLHCSPPGQASKSSSNWEWPSSFWTRWSMENPSMPFKICRKPLNSTTGILWQWLELREEWVCCKWPRSSFPGPWKWHRNEAANTFIFWPPASILQEFFQNLGKILNRMSGLFQTLLICFFKESKYDEFFLTEWRQKPFIQGHGGWTNEGANNRFIRVVKIDSSTVTSLKQPQLFVEISSSCMFNALSPFFRP